jgi:hypothetical protein
MKALLIAMAVGAYQTTPPDAVNVEAKRIDCVEFTTVETEFVEQRALECQVDFYGETVDGHEVSYPVQVYAKDFEDAERRATITLHRQLRDNYRPAVLFFNMLKKEIEL